MGMLLQLYTFVWVCFKTWCPSYFWNNVKLWHFILATKTTWPTYLVTSSYFVQHMEQNYHYCPIVDEVWSRNQEDISIKVDILQCVLSWATPILVETTRCCHFRPWEITVLLIIVLRPIKPDYHQQKTCRDNDVNVQSISILPSDAFLGKMASGPLVHFPLAFLPAHAC